MAFLNQHVADSKFLNRPLKSHTPYSGKLLREKMRYSWSAHLSRTKEYHVPNFAKKTFTNNHKTTKFAKVFSLESFPLYGIVRDRRLLTANSNTHYIYRPLKSHIVCETHTFVDHLTHSHAWTRKSHATLTDLSVQSGVQCFSLVCCRKLANAEMSLASSTVSFPVLLGTGLRHGSFSLDSTVQWGSFKGENFCEFVKNMIFAEKTFVDCSLLPCQRMPRLKFCGENVCV